MFAGYGVDYGAIAGSRKIKALTDSRLFCRIKTCRGDARSLQRGCLTTRVVALSQQLAVLAPEAHDFGAELALLLGGLGADPLALGANGVCLGVGRVALGSQLDAVATCGVHAQRQLGAGLGWEVQQDLMTE